MHFLYFGCLATDLLDFINMLLCATMVTVSEGYATKRMNMRS